MSRYVPLTLRWDEELLKMSGVDGDPPQSETPLVPSPYCQECGGTMVLRTVIGRFDTQPGFRIFECSECHRLLWQPITR